METIPKSECRKVGFIRKTHGVQGELVLEYEPEFEDAAAEALQFFLEVDGLLVPFFVAGEGFRYKSSNSAIIRFDWIESESQARRLVGASVYLSEAEIANIDTELSVTGLIDYMLFDENGHEVGIITAVDDYSGNVVLTLNAKGEELLVPFNEDFLIDLDEKKKIIRLSLPDGLFE